MCYYEAETYKTVNCRCGHYVNTASVLPSLYFATVCYSIWYFLVGISMNLE